MSISLVTFSFSAQQNQPKNMSEEPKALKKQTVLMNHDHKRVDDYFWMNERDSKEVLDQLNSIDRLVEMSHLMFVRWILSF